jgi:hypothetical protein
MKKEELHLKFQFGSKKIVPSAIIALWFVLMLLLDLSYLLRKKRKMLQLIMKQL